MGHILNTSKKKRRITAPSTLDAEERKHAAYRIKRSVRVTIDDLIHIMDACPDESLVRYVRAEIARLPGVEAADGPAGAERDDAGSGPDTDDMDDVEKAFWADTPES